MAGWKTTSLPPTLGPPGGPEAWKVGGGRAATAVEKGGGMSATQAENKQTAVPLPGGSRRHVFLAWQSLRQGLCVSKEETEAPEALPLTQNAPPSVLSYCLQAKALSLPLHGASVSPPEQGVISSSMLLLLLCPLPGVHQHPCLSPPASSHSTVRTIQVVTTCPLSGKIPSG